MNQEDKTIKRHRPAIGIPLMIVATFFNAAMATMVKLIINEYSLPNQLLVFFRFVISFLLLLPILFLLPKYQPIKSTLKINIWPPYVVRIISGLLAIYAYFYAIQKISLSNAVLLTYTSPLFIPIVAWVWKGTPIAPRLWWGLILGFIGVSLIIGPKVEGFQMGYFIGLIAGLLAAVSYVAGRLQSYSEKPITINFYYFLGAALVAFLLTAKSFFVTVSTYPLRLWVMLILLGVFGALFQGISIIALRWTQARFLGAFFYLAVGYAILIEWALFNSIPSFYSFLGLGLVALGGVVMTILDPAKKKVRDVTEN